MKTKVYITRSLPESVMKKFAENFELKMNKEDRSATREELEEGIKWADILVCLLNDPIDSELMDLNPNLKGICNYAVGFNNIDVKAASQRNIIVTNTPDVLTETTADFAWALMMAVSRRVVEADKISRDGKFPGWGPLYMLGTDVYGKTLGIIGTGRIGSAFARRALGFKMDILYYDIKPKPEMNALNAKFVSLNDLLQNSDFISIHAPLTPDTTGLIGKSQFELMKPTSFLINTARGPIIDEKALLWALENNVIAGAGLDVFHNEPNITPGLEKFDNVVIAPHIASASIETRTNMGFLVFDNVTAIAQGNVPVTPVN